MRRILHFMSNISINSGVAAIVMNFYRHIDRNRIQFDFLYFEDSSLTYAQEISSLGGRAFQIPRPSPFSMGKIFAFFCEHYGEFWGLHCHPIWAAALIGPVAKRYGVHAVFLHSHSEKPGESRISIMRNRILLRLSTEKVDTYIACSQAAKAAFGKNACRAYVLPNAIDTRAFSFDEYVRHACRSQLGISPETIVIGHVGRMVEVKNHHFLLEVFSLYLQTNSDAQLLLIGDGPLEQSLQTLTKKLKIQERVQFLGAQQDTARLYAAMDIFVMPSQYEGLSMALLEAQAAGLPCLVSNTVSMESDVTGRMCRLPLGSPQQWAEVLAEHLCKPLERNKGIFDAFEAKRLDIHIAVQDLTAFYEKI